MGNVLVTGSAGFIGRHLVAALQRDGYAVHAMGGEYDVTEESSWNTFGTPDAVVHLAGRSSVRKGEADPLPAYRVNVVGTMKAMRFCSKTGARLIFASTASVYGTPHSLPVREDDSLQPQNAYACSKMMAEATIKKCRVPSVIMRFANVYGPGQSKDFLIPTILEQLPTGRVVLDNPSSKREYVFIDDVVNAIIAALRSTHAGVFNIGTGKSTSVEELMTILRKLYGQFSVSYANSYADGVQDIYFDSSSAQKFLGWHAETQLEEGLRKTLRSRGLLCEKSPTAPVQNYCSSAT